MPSRPLFDAYVVVDWSASATPNTGQDSVWIGEAARQRGRITVGRPDNPSTRSAAHDLILRRLLAHVGARRRGLIAFDFVYGYPRGFADALGLTGPEPPWLRVWRMLADRVCDDEGNRNNRWAVAAELNRRLGAAPGPFWNVPRAFATPELCVTKGVFPHVLPGASCLAEYRIADAPVTPDRARAAG
jgi:hypothetical protein